MNVSGRKMNWGGTRSATFLCVSAGRHTVIHVRRFMLLFVDVECFASAMDVKLNSCHHQTLSAHSPTHHEKSNKYRLNQLLRLCIQPLELVVDNVVKLADQARQLSQRPLIAVETVVL